MGHRIIITYVATLMVCSVLIYQLAVLATGTTYLQATTTQSTYTLKVGEQRGYIYDRNLNPLVNQTEETTLSVAPTPYALLALQQQLSPEDFALYHPLLSQGKPLLISASQPVVGLGVTSFDFPVRYSSTTVAPHVIGYLDSEKNGVVGIEKGYNTQLTQFGGSVETQYQITATGTVLGEDVINVTDTRYSQKGGVVLTLDRNIQSLVEQAASPMEKGAVVVMEVDTGEILALASLPSFSPLDVGSVLGLDTSPLINRATTPYSVGSTFKLVVAAAALENGYTPELDYICTGSYTLNDVTYACHATSGHWEIDMWRGTQQSCNPYFISLGLNLGADIICRYASAFGFGNGTELAPAIISQTGNLPTSNTVTSGELANLSFGQGKLLATPVQVAQLTAIIANGGNYVPPTLTTGITYDGVTPPIQSPVADLPVITQQTATTLQQLMISVVEVGSGHGAVPTTGSAGGKTATAQTGSYKSDGKEIVNGWFTGFYPAENPKYAITVLEEDGSSGGELPAKIFADICSGIALLDDPILNRYYN